MFGKIVSKYVRLERRIPTSSSVAKQASKHVRYTVEDALSVSFNCMWHELWIQVWRRVSDQAKEDLTGERVDLGVEAMFWPQN